MDEQKQHGEFLSHLLNGNNAVIRNDLETAIVEYEMALKHNPDFFLTFTKLGNVYYRVEKYEKAIECFRKSLDLNPEQTATLYQLGKAYHKAGMNVQAAVAYDMAMEKDRGGDYTSAIESRKRKIRQHSSGKSLNEIRAGEVVKESLSIFFRRPGLILPFIAVSILMYIAHVCVRRLVDNLFSDGFSIISVSSMLLASPSENNLPLFVYYGIMSFVAAFACAPFCASCMVDANRIRRGQKPLKVESIVASFSQLSPLGSIALLFIIATFFAATSTVFVLHIVEKAFFEFFNFNLELHPLVVFAFPLVSVYFAYAFPCVIIEKHQMESGLRKGLKYGRKYGGITIGLFLFYSAAHMAISVAVGKYAPDFAFQGHMISKQFMALIALAPFQAFTAISVAMVYTMGQEVKKKKSSRSSRDDTKRMSTEELEEPEYDLEEELRED